MILAIFVLVILGLLVGASLYLRKRQGLSKPKKIDRGVEIAIMSWFHDNPLCKIPASDILGLYDIIKPYLKTNDPTPTIPEDTKKRGIRSVQPEVRRSRRITVRAWDADGVVKVLDDDSGEGDKKSPLAE